MTANPPGGRGLTVGVRTCLLLAALLLVAGGYLLLAPLERVSSAGVPFDCGTALVPAGGDFARSVCGDLNHRRQLQTGAVGIAAVVLIVGGVLAYGGLPHRRRPAALADEPALATAADERAWRVTPPDPGRHPAGHGEEQDQPAAPRPVEPGPSPAPRPAIPRPAALGPPAPGPAALGPSAPGPIAPGNVAPRPAVHEPPAARSGSEHSTDPKQG